MPFPSYSSPPPSPKKHILQYHYLSLPIPASWLLHYKLTLFQTDPGETSVQNQSQAYSLAAISQLFFSNCSFPIVNSPTLPLLPLVILRERHLLQALFKVLVVTYMALNGVGLQYLKSHFFPHYLAYQLKLFSQSLPEELQQGVT